MLAVIIVMQFVDTMKPCIFFRAALFLMLDHYYYDVVTVVVVRLYLFLLESAIAPFCQGMGNSKLQPPCILLSECLSEKEKR